MTDATLIADLVSAGVPAELVGRVSNALVAAAAERAAVLIPDEAAERRRAADRERKAKFRGIPQTSADSADTPPSLDKENPPHPLKKLNPTPPSLRSESVSAREADDWPSDFRQRFWDRYPRKVAKAKALRALETVRRAGGVTFAALMAAVERYAAAKLDSQFVKHPATWLNGGCWDDDPAALARAGPQPVQPRTMFEQKQQELKDVRSELRAYIDRTSNDPGGTGVGVLPRDSGERSEDVFGRSDRVVELLPTTNIRAFG